MVVRAAGFGGGIDMKNGLDAAAVGRAPDPEDYSNRKLIRPSLGRETRTGDSPERRNGNGDRGPGAAKKVAPPEQTHAENFYYQKQMQTKTPMVVVTIDGEELHGVIEWYDRSCIKLNRASGGNLLVYKASIKYMYKEGELEGK
jgi:sRNA-binding regulator protein Hfq